MKTLQERVRLEGKNLGRNILKVDSFINHQVDPQLMLDAGRDLAERFKTTGVTKVLTAEISGIAPAFTTALTLGLPVVYARKTKPITMPAEVFRRSAPSHTKGKEVELMISPEFLSTGERILIIDDFLASGRTILALANLVADAGATLVGIGGLIEKSFEGGRGVLAHLNVPIEALVVITDMTDGRIVFEGE